MNYDGLTLPIRHEKPRTNGITILIDNGVPLNFFKDTIMSAAPYIDFVKFGWGTSIISSRIQEKIACLKDNNVDFFFGGTLFEKFLSQGKIDDYYKYCNRFGCQYVEISNGTLPLSNFEKSILISEFSKEFTVLSEVGSKDTDKSMSEDPMMWLEYIQEDLEAGAYKVITEARESGTSGICNGNGEIRTDMMEMILNSGISLESVIFEAPNKKLQTFFITELGPNVNLANISFSDPIALETLRVGLRSDTFFIGGYVHERRE
jgi:phosphosulfolactate synthase